MFRDQRGAVGCGRTAEPVYGKWCWEPEALAFISGHYETGEPCRRSCWIKCWRRRTTRRRCYPASAGVRPVRFPPPCRVPPDQGAKILETLAEIKKLVAVVRLHPGAVSRTLSAIFSPVVSRRLLQLPVGRRAGGRCLLAFEEEGIFNRETGQSFLDNILAVAVQKSRWICSNASVVVNPAGCDAGALRH